MSHPSMPNEGQAAILKGFVADPIPISWAAKRLGVSHKVALRWCIEAGVIDGCRRAAAMVVKRNRRVVPALPEEERIRRRKESDKRFEEKRKAEGRVRVRNRAKPKPKAEHKAPEPQPFRQQNWAFEGLTNNTRPALPPGPTLIKDPWKRDRIRDRIAAGQSVDLILRLSPCVTREAVELEMANWWAMR